MPIPITNRESRTVGIEPLEARIALAVSSIDVSRALDLLDGTAITLSGNAASFATLKLAATGQLLGFPSGGDGDFLVLSTGVASQLTSPNTGSNQGTDLGPEGADGDSASVAFTVEVPQFASGRQRFKIDFMFLSEEYPEFTGSNINDQFTVVINGTNYAVDGQGNLMEVDNGFFTGAPATGTYFDGRSDKITLTYEVPDGVTTLNIELRISDVGDGQTDSAVLVDNARFQTQELIYVDFDGGTLDGHFGPGINGEIPAFKPEDVGSAMELETLIDDIISRLNQKYAAYDIKFVSTQPLYGDYGTVVVGGTNDVMLDLTNANPLVKSQFPGGQATVGDLFNLGNDSLLGLAGAPDVGNLNHNDKAVIFSGEFAGFFQSGSLVDHLVVTIAHEVGHNLGLRHVSDSNPGDVMSQTAPRLDSAVFGSTLLPLAEQWSDGTTLQNDHAYLLSVLGGSGGNVNGLQASIVAPTTNFVPRFTQTIYDATIHITTGDPDVAGITLHFDKLDGTQNIALPLLPAGAKISIVGASTPGGAIDTFSGSPNGGFLTSADNAVPLFDANGNLAVISLAKKQAGGGFVPAGQVPLLENGLGGGNLIPGKVITFTEEDGDQYTIKLTGPGLIAYTLDDPDHNGKGALASLVVEGTTLKDSILSITVLQRAPNGDGRVEVGLITGVDGAALKSLSAPMATFIGGGVMFDGAIAALNLGDLTSGADVITGAAEGTKTSVRLHSVQDGSAVSIGTAVTTFTAARLGEAVISLPSVVKMTIAGDKLAGLTPDVAAHIQIAGHLGNLNAGDLASTASITAGGSPLDRTVLALRSVADGVSVSLASTVSSLRASAIGDATFSAQQFDSVILTGNLAGDFFATGKLGRLTARDMLGTSSITAGGLGIDKSVLVLHEIQDGAEITLESKIQLLRAAKIGDAEIRAVSMGTLLVTGDARAGLAGDFKGTLVLDGGDPDLKNALASVRITGGMIGASISADTIGTFTAASMKDSTIFAGYTPAAPGQPFNGGVFFDGGSIRSFTIRSGTAAFDNSVVASKSIGTIRVVSADFDNAGTAFGFLTNTAPSRVSISSFPYNKAGPADQSVGDLHVRIL